MPLENTKEKFFFCLSTLFTVLYSSIKTSRLNFTLDCVWFCSPMYVFCTQKRAAQHSSFSYFIDLNLQTPYDKANAILKLCKVSRRFFSGGTPKHCLIVRKRSKKIHHTPAATERYNTTFSWHYCCQTGNWKLRYI